MGARRTYGLGGGVIGAVLLSAASSAGATGPTPQELLAQLLVAGDIADACPHLVQRRAGRDPNTFVAEGVIQIINENDVTMTDLIAVQETTSRQRMHLLKRDELTRRGVDIADRKEVCFFAQQVVGSSDRIGRYLEAR